MHFCLALEYNQRCTQRFCTCLFQIFLHQRWAKWHKNQCLDAACLVKITMMTCDGYDVFVIGKKRSFYANQWLVNLFSIEPESCKHVPNITLETHIELSKMHSSDTYTHASYSIDVIRTLEYSFKSVCAFELMLWFSVYLSGLWMVIKCILLYLLFKSRF